MATLAEKQEAVKEILGSRESLRRFVKDAEIHIEDLETYSAIILSIILEEKEARVVKVKRDAQNTIQKLREQMALAGLTSDEIDDALGVSSSERNKQSFGGVSKKRGASKGIVRAKYIFPLLDGTESEPLAVQGNRKSDSPVMLACTAAGYTSLSAWVKGDERIRKV